MSNAVLSLVVVLNKVEDRLAVWHVNVGRPIGLSRLSGAWVLGAEREEVASLTAGYRAFDCGEGSLDGLEVAGVIDLDATVAAARAEVAAVDEAFTAHQELGNKLVRPQWPEIGHPLETRLPSSEIDEAVRPVLAAARGIADLADAWAAFESLRTARSFLADLGGKVARPLPLTVR
ncbi:hypothetical protein [Nocardia yamanashiensis]|uniref:hypothetical protein n=1 Tax=Nocardia yamanashiensis TaxID=209247 RepID=UPI00082A99FD|nr:hypothetical protein [Nocardia yamanashiensis]